MDAFLQAVGVNALLAGLLAVAAAIITRWVRRPEVAYWLWALVLLKLVTPPLLHLPIPFRCGGSARYDLSTPQVFSPSTTATRGQPPPRDLSQRPSPEKAITVASPRSRYTPGDALNRRRATTTDRATPGDSAILRPSSTPGEQAPANVGRVPWRWMILGGWLGGSAIWFCLAGVRLVRFGRLLARSQAAPEHLCMAARQLCERLGVRRCPDLRVLEARIPPLLWCSGRRAIIVLPNGLLTQLPGSEQAALVAHELAHYRRRDHLTRWIMMLILGLYWWHPAVWWALRRLQQAEEQCCDAWVVWALPGEASRYAGTLLATVEFLSLPRTSLPLVASGFGEVGALKRRMEMILARTLPWRMSRVGLAALLLLAALVLPWSLRASSASPAAEGTAARKGDNVMESQKKSAGELAAGPARRRISGVVRGPDGAAVAGTEIYLEARRTPSGPASGELLPVALPEEEKAKWQLDPKPDFRILGRARTDSAGRFVLETQSMPASNEVGRVVAMARHFGLALESWDDKAGELEIHLPAMVLIEGRLLTPDRRPAADVVVKATYLNRGKDYDAGADRYLAEKDYPPYWPRPVRSNAQGEFTLTGMPTGCHLVLDLTHPSFAREEVTVDTGQGATDSTRGFEIALLPPTFTHVLSPPRPVEGLVTAADTGNPLSAVLVTVDPMNRHGGMDICTHTDAAGHYRVSDKAGETYFITVYAPPDSGYLGEYAHRDRWPKDAQSLVQDFKLPRGILVHGRVLDGATGKPVAGASVQYQPARKNPNDSPPKNPGPKAVGSELSYEYRNPVLTDAEGRFTLTVLKGAGYLSVETPERIYVRKPSAEGGYALRSMPMGYTPIDAAPAFNGEVIIRLRRGRTVTLQAVGPGGEHLPSVLAAWEGRDAVHEQVWNNGESFADGKIVVQGVDPDRTTRIFLINLERKVGAVYDITAKTPAGPIEIRLPPNGTITGQAVTENAEPADAQAYLKMGFGPPFVRLSTKEPDIFHYQFYGNFTNEYGHNERIPGGRFRFDNVLPGIPLVVVASGEGEGSGALSVEPLRPGEHRDVGKVLLSRPATQNWKTDLQDILDFLGLRK